MIEKRRVLFLDDRSKRFKAAIEKYKDDDLTIVCTVKEAKKLISTQDFDILSLDHDLNFGEFVSSDRQDCGMELVRWMCDDFLRMPVNRFTRYMSYPGYDGNLRLTRREPDTIIFVHTSNEAAGRKMTVTLNNHDFWAIYERFSYD